MALIFSRVQLGFSRGVDGGVTATGVLVEGGVFKLPQGAGVFLRRRRENFGISSCSKGKFDDF